MDNDEKIIKNKLVMLGDVAVGKTSITQRFVNKVFMNLYEPTVAALFLAKKIKVNNCSVKFEIWDTAGQERFNALIPIYYRNAKAAIVVFDVTNKNSFERAKKWLNELIEKASKDIIISLCANKIDIDERQVSAEEGKKLAEEYGTLYMEVSAKQNINIEELFQNIALKLPNDENKKDDEERKKLEKDKLKENKKESCKAC